MVERSHKLDYANVHQVLFFIVLPIFTEAIYGFTMSHKLIYPQPSDRVRPCELCMCVSANEYISRGVRRKKKSKLRNVNGMRQEKKSLKGRSELNARRCKFFGRMKKMIVIGRIYSESHPHKFSHSLFMYHVRIACMLSI